jgi:beta-lactamase regulating signal transducer with metallopeptidase domain
VAALLQIGLVNAAVATVLACLVALVACKVRRPALTHALWIIVLAKLITPPVFEVPIEVPFELPGMTAAIEEAVAPMTAIVNGAPEWFADSERTSDVVANAVNTAPGPGEPSGAPIQESSAGRRRLSAAQAVWAAGAHWVARHVVAVIVGTWALGSAAWFLLQTFTAYKFSQRLALATPAPAGIQREADDLAAAMGLAHRPPVMIVRDVISPMLWGIGRNTRLLFPVNLLSRLEPGARATLIAHELAHYRRGDHWVRAFELVVGGVFWWHPVVWWARRQIEIAEEECCDAWVIEQFPDTPRWYAEALLETIDFLSEAALVLPPAAAGAGHVPFLRQRLIAIMRGVAPQKMTLRTWSAVLLVALASLPWHPGLTTARDREVAAADSATEATTDAGPEIDPAALAAKLDEIAKTMDGELNRAAQALAAPVANDVEWATAHSPGGRYSITRRGSDGVYLYDAVANQQIYMTEYRILTVAFSPDGERFATGGADSTVRLWSSSTGAHRKAFRGHASAVHSVAFIHEGQELISASNDGRLMRWNLADGNEQSSADCPHTPANCLAVSSDGRWLAIGTGSWMKDEGGKIVIWDLATLEKSAEFQCQDPVGVLMFKPDGKTLAAGDFQGRVTFWDVSAQQRLGATLPRYKDAIAAARFSLDTQALASVTTEEIYEELRFQVPNSLRWFFDRSVNLPRLANPVAGVRFDRGNAIPLQQDGDDVDRLQHIRQGIKMLEQELEPAERPTAERGIGGPFTQ